MSIESILNNLIDCFVFPCTAYIEAREEMKATDRQRLISETKSLLQDIVQSGELNPSLVKPAASAKPSPQQESSKGTKKP